MPSFQANSVSDLADKVHAGNSEQAEKNQSSKQEAIPVDWDKPSGGSYPVLTKNEPIWIDVSIKDQKVYIKKGTKTLYTMIASTGKDTDPDTTTPTGTYYIQAERGKWFYSPKYKEGAKYWVSWKNHGEFLFHSVPMDQNKQILTADAEKLGEKDSHGCIHLTVPDSKWIYEHIPYNTKVVIHS
ncbi:L,D-transpeptidase family protein [Sporolactobacillus shoreicorticis]|nr:L,D-transpeptidase family protein [Sporolactobacillus shoreicorticis]MCO7125568.1 L,D-transpeptidase family protein [Sporolactobacillus shoreicorticis]